MVSGLSALRTNIEDSHLQGRGSFLSEDVARRLGLPPGSPRDLLDAIDSDAIPERVAKYADKYWKFFTGQGASSQPAFQS